MPNNVTRKSRVHVLMPKNPGFMFLWLCSEGPVLSVKPTPVNSCLQASVWSMECRWNPFQSSNIFAFVYTRSFSFSVFLFETHVFAYCCTCFMYVSYLLICSFVYGSNQLLYGMNRLTNGINRLLMAVFR